MNNAYLMKIDKFFLFLTLILVIFYKRGGVFIANYLHLVKLFS